jgi:putative tricarboxylic transport membrane protein
LESTRKIGSGLFFLGLSLFILRESFRVGLGTAREPGSGFIPLCTGLILFFLSLALIHHDWKVLSPSKKLPVRVVLALAALFAYSLALETLGFPLATFILVAVLFRIGEARRWWVIILMSLLATSVAYLVFHNLLNVYFPRGILGV